MTKSQIVVIILSLLWGIGLAILFKNNCPETGCHMIKVPDASVEQHPVMTDQGPVIFKRYYVPCDLSQ